VLVVVISHLPIFEVNACKGLVVAGFGGGTMPDNLNGLVAETANSGCTVVVSSRVSQVTVLAETMTSVKVKMFSVRFA
jgi:Asparaginase.